MNKIIVALIASVVSPAWADSGNLELTVNGLQNDQGTVRVALFHTSEAYDKSAEDKGAFQSVEIPIQKGVARYVFNGIPYGDYAIKLYHDENGNKKLDTNFVGIPKEPYGFSNNARGTLLAPEYVKAKFTLNAANKAIEIKPYK